MAFRGFSAIRFEMGRVAVHNSGAILPSVILVELSEEEEITYFSGERGNVLVASWGFFKGVYK